MTARLIDGAGIAERVEAEVRAERTRLSGRGIEPRLVSIQVGEDPAAQLYLKRQSEAFERLEVPFQRLALGARTGEAELLRTIRDLNRDPQVTGIMLQLPLPPGIDARRARRALDPEKDVEGVHPENLGYLLSGSATLIPCTAAAVLEGIAATGTAVAGKEAVVVGHSETVGRPVALLLMERLATVTVCHHETRGLFDHTRRGEILVVAVGREGLVPGDAIREGAVVIDVGINPRPPGSTPRVVGDVDAAGAESRASWRTPVPGGVGPITVAMLLRNTVRAADAQAAR